MQEMSKMNTTNSNLNLNETTQALDRCEVNFNNLRNTFKIQDNKVK